ncbi:MAG: hypothetical protein GW946_01855 [Candidatus Pacebacteria bacterium]|nr:hypothetical protein [Candidatus Paceibacterota bacterium]PIR60492.1 MAG: hypothetical protein COU67_01830 [Candidatus Pacebacteria bacterium CG10_big_fil_rev_8_21_14_0_10_44_54]
MHKLDLSAPQIPSEEPQTAPEPMKTAVDALPVESNNQTLKRELPMKKRNMILGFYIAAILAGIATGYGSFQLYAGSSDSSTTKSNDTMVVSKVAGDNVKNGDVFGSTDANAFEDSATGFLEAGGINGEGSHKLLRPGGVSQTVYLTSSVTDLDKLVGMEVTVWGETFKAQKAGWLMDVGRVEVVEVDGTAPTEK